MRIPNQTDLSIMNRRDFLELLALALTPSTPLLAQTTGTSTARPRRLLLKSGWQTVNIGDIGHTPGMLRLLEEQLPEVEVWLWPNNIGDGAEEMLRRNFPKVKIVQGQDVKAAFETCDFLLHGSGPSLVAAKSLDQWRTKTGKPYGVLGITYGGPSAAKQKPVLDQAKFVFFRDSISLEQARKDGVQCPILEFGPDAAFSVNLRNDAAAVPFLKQHGLEDGKFLCAIPRLRNSPYWLIHQKPMTDLDRRKDAENQQLKEHDHVMVRDALVAFVRTTGMRVLLCPEDKSHMAVGKEMFLDRLPADVRPQFVWRENYWLTDEAVSVYARALGLLSMDMHSPIMAVANGTPAIVCRFHQQTSKGQMWRDIGLGPWLFDLDVEQDGTRITEAVLAIARDPAAARAKVAAAMQCVRQRQKVAVETVRRFV